MPLKYIMIVCKEMAIEHFNKEENKIGENRNKNNKKHKRSNVFNIITHYGIFFMHFSVWDLHVYVYEKKNEKKCHHTKKYVDCFTFIESIDL